MRLASALLAPWFAFVVADPVPMQGCAMHEAVPATASAAEVGGGAATPSERVADAGMAHHGHHAMPVNGAATTTDTTPAQQHGQGHSCTCLGACCVATPAPLPVSALSLHTAPVGLSAGSRAAVVPRTIAVVVPDPYLRPCANGPPVTATA